MDWRGAPFGETKFGLEISNWMKILILVRAQKRPKKRKENENEENERKLNEIEQK